MALAQLREGREYIGAVASVNPLVIPVFDFRTGLARNWHSGGTEKRVLAAHV